MKERGAPSKLGSGAPPSRDLDYFSEMGFDSAHGFGFIAGLPDSKQIPKSRWFALGAHR
jgi:hypothetical protein